MVDTVLYLEGERFHAFRLLRSVKNRFGSTNEVGVFEMAEGGLIEVVNPSGFSGGANAERAGLGHRRDDGRLRPILVEVERWLERPRCPAPAYGQRRRLQSAVADHRGGQAENVRLGDQDVFVNVVGGLQVDEPAVDVAVAVASSVLRRPVAADLALVGEIGLSGELPGDRATAEPDRRTGQLSSPCWCRPRPAQAGAAPRAAGAEGAHRAGGAGGWPWWAAARGGRPS